MNQELMSNTEMIRYKCDSTYEYVFMNETTGKTISVQSDLREPEIRAIIRYLTPEGHILSFLNKAPLSKTELD